MVANLPFYITKDCLRLMLPLGECVSHLFFLLQVRKREHPAQLGRCMLWHLSWHPCLTRCLVTPGRGGCAPDTVHTWGLGFSGYEH